MKTTLISVLLSTGALVASSPLALPAAGAQTSSAASGTYQCYTGNGSPTAGWPSAKQWLSFDALWAANLNTLQNSCAWNTWGANNSPTEIAALQAAIRQVSQTTKVDKRFILATVMQESEGCVHVPTTNNGVVNPGLMQSHDGSGTCANVSPCPASEITQMIHDGVAGTSAGPGLEQLMAQARPHSSDSHAQTVYIAARLFNSGSADYSDLNNGISSTASYVNDIANRLMGWTTAAKGCTPS